MTSDSKRHGNMQMGVGSSGIWWVCRYLLCGRVAGLLGVVAVGGRLLGRRFLKFLMGSCEFSDEV